MAKGKKQPTTATAAAIAQPILDEMGLRLWDVRFEKEGSLWFLRYYIDKDGGVTIADCEAFSRAVDKRLDDEDPIPDSYTLEVSSPGVERELTRDWHYEACLGKTIHLRLIRPVEGVRDFVGVLAGYSEGVITLQLDEDLEMNADKGEVSFVRLYYDYDSDEGDMEG